MQQPNVVTIMLETAAGTAPLCDHRVTAWTAVKIIPVRFWSLITVRPRQSQDVRLRWGRDSFEYWQKGSSVPALVPWAFLMLMLLCPAVDLSELKAMWMQHSLSEEEKCSIVNLLLILLIMVIDPVLTLHWSCNVNLQLEIVASLSQHYTKH